MRIEIPLFSGFDDLDAIGPFETLRLAGWDVRLVGVDGAGEITSSHGAVYRLATGLGRPDAVIVPGGGWSDPGPGARVEAERGVLTEWLARTAPGCRWTASVCTGAMLLASAGLLKGRKATTHHSAHDELATFGVDVRRQARFVDDGDVLTAAGVTAGIDLAVHLLERESGAETAAAVALDLELPSRLER